MKFPFSWILAIGFALVCAGCHALPEPGHVPGYVGLGYIGTDRTPLDRLSGWVSGQDCSSARAARGGHWCQPVYENRPEADDLYCYRSIGTADCYSSPSLNPHDQLVGVVPGGLQRTW